MPGRSKPKRRKTTGQGMFDWILAVVRRIPRGKVATYGQVARAAGYPGAARQVVWALHTSRGLSWHRVVGSRGRILLGGEAGFEQRLRLQHEGITFAGDRVRMERHQVSWGQRRQRKSKRHQGQPGSGGEGKKTGKN